MKYIVVLDWPTIGRRFMRGTTPNGYMLVSEYPDAEEYSRRDAMKVGEHARKHWPEADSVRVYSNYGHSIDSNYIEVI